MKRAHLRAIGDGDAEQGRRRDEANKRFLRVAPGVFLQAHRKLYLLSEGTAAEREAAAVSVRRKLLAVLVIGAAVVFVPEFIPRDPPAPAAEPVTERVGTIESLELHETAFSTSTTVRTSDGIFQVNGAVSAKEGDSVTLKTLDRAGRTTSREVCIASTIMPACYPVKE